MLQWAVDELKCDKRHTQGCVVPMVKMFLHITYYEPWLEAPHKTMCFHTKSVAGNVNEVRVPCGFTLW